MKILYAGCLDNGSTCVSRMNAMTSLKFEVVPFDFNPYLSNRYFFALAFHRGWGPAISRLNAAFLQEVKTVDPDVIWIDKGIYVTPATLTDIKKYNRDIKIIHINPDDPYGQNQEGFRLFKKAIPFYDIHFVSRPQNIKEYLNAGAKQAFEYDRSFDPLVHVPVTLGEAEVGKYRVQVGFIGSYAIARADMLLFLIQHHVPVAIYGDRWERYPRFEEIKHCYKGPAVYGAEYTKAICGMEIAIHFLRKENRDAQDSRTYEIPACGTFMIAERSERHEAVFAENRDAVFFDTAEELLEKVTYYMRNPMERDAIAKNGRRRSVTSGYDHVNRMRSLLQLAGVMEETLELYLH